MSLTTLIVDDDNSIKNIFVYNATIKGTLTANNAPVLPEVITDPTDIALTVGNIIIGDGDLNVKQSGVNIDNLNSISGISDLSVSGNVDADSVSANEFIGTTGTFDNIDVNIINGSALPDFADVITDTTDVVLSTGKIMISNGNKDIKESVIDCDAFGDLSNVGDISTSGTIDCGTLYALTGIIDQNTSERLILTGGANDALFYNTVNTFHSILKAPTMTSNKTVTIPDLAGTMAISGASQNVSFAGITGSTGAFSDVNISGNLLNGITIPASGGTYAKLTDIPSVATTVTSTSTLATNYLTKGEDGTRKILNSGVACDGSNNLTGIPSINGTTTNTTDGCINTYYTTGLNRTFEAFITGAGTVTSVAGGVSCSRTDVGKYLITFSCTLISAPQVTGANVNDWGFYSVGHTGGTNTCVVWIRDSTVSFNFADRDFNIIATARV